MEEDCAAFGLPPDAFPRRDARCAVIEENVPIVQAWAIVATQMTHAGLRYEGVRAGLALARVRCTPELFAGLRVMEHEVLAAWSERDG